MVAMTTSPFTRLTIAVPTTRHEARIAGDQLYLYHSAILDWQVGTISSRQVAAAPSEHCIGACKRI